MTKKELEEETEDSELEEEIEEEQEFLDENKFVEFMQTSKGSFSTALEKVNSSQETPINLEQDLIQSTSFDKKKSEEDPFNYSSKINQEDQPKYQSFEQEVFQPHTTDITSLGMDSFQQKNEIGFTSSIKDFGPPAQEQYTPIKNQDISDLGKENPFEKKEVKYKLSQR